MTLWSILAAALLITGLVIAVGGMAFVLVRRRGSLGANLALFAAAAVGLCLMLILILAGALYPIRRQHQEDVRRAETQARLRQMGEALHNRDALEQAQRLREYRPVDPSIPIEAPRPGAGVTIGDDGERLVRNTPSEPLPDWVTEGTIDVGDGRLVVVSGQQFADPDQAERNALSEATVMILHDFMHARQPWGTFDLNPEQVRKIAVHRSFTESIERTAGENNFTVYRTYLQVAQSDESRREVEAIWKKQAATGRSVIFAGLLVLLTAIAGIVSGYFRLDDRTGGRYRWRLRLAAIAATVLIGGTLFAGTQIASSAMRHCPLQTPSTTVSPAAPSEARALPSETSVDAERRQKFRLIADRIVEAINAGDYEGVRRDFNENMLDRFPPEKCREFFREKIADKYGTIHTLEPAQFKSPSTASYTARCERGTLRLILVLDEQDQVAGLVLIPRSAHADARG